MKRITSEQLAQAGYALVDDPVELATPQQADIAPAMNGRRTSWTAAELFDAPFPKPRFAVDGLIPEGLTFLCGAPKLGKSWLVLALSIAVTAGGKALGQIDVERGEVLYLALEDSPRRLQVRMRMLDEQPPDGLYLETAWPRLDDGGAERLAAWLDAHTGARLVVIDVWPRVRPRGKGSDYYTLDYDAAAPLQALAISRGIAIIVLYHTRKAESADFVETVTGTFGTAAAADTIIVVKRSRGDADTTLHVTGRDVQEQELALRFAPEAGTWTLLGDASKYALGESRREVRETIEAYGTLTPKEVAALSTISHDLAKKTMARMAKDGQLVADHGKYHLPALGTPVPGVPLSPDRNGDGDTALPQIQPHSGQAVDEGGSPRSAVPPVTGHFAGCSRRPV